MAERAGRTEWVWTALRRLRPFLGKKADEVYRAYLLEDADGKEQIEVWLEGMLAERFDVDLASNVEEPLPPEPQTADGSYRLGTVLYAGKELGPFGLRESEWIQHVGVFGRTGAGKTNLGYLILGELKRHQKPFLVFDWKRNYRDLIAKPEFADIEIYTIGRPIAALSFNPLIPPEGTPPKTWLKKIIEVIAHAYMLGNGVLYLLQQCVDAVYEKLGVYSNAPQRFPTFRDVLDELKNYPGKGREAGRLSSALRALSALCFGDMEAAANWESNRRLDQLLERPVVLELDALAQSDKIFFIQALLLWIHHRRMVEGFREQFKHAILIEEAHHVLSGERRSLIGGQSVMEITFREIREFGEALIILDQHPSQISLPALGNTYATICLNLKHSHDVNAIAQCMLMDTKERDILGALPVGQAVVKLQGRVSKPFLIQIPPFDLQKGTTPDAVIAARKRTIFISYRRTLPQPPVATAVPSLVLPGADPAAPSLEIQFLDDIAHFPDSGIAKRYERLGLSVRQGQKLKERMAKEGLILDAKEITPTGAKRVVRLADKGQQALEDWRGANAAATDQHEPLESETHVDRRIDRADGGSQSPAIA
ncbi:MAG: DUF87 domain-containing protein [Candidatus Sumerlaeota bacterium]|nr:DUF87 domain-containing protein [Candidatus Sumerlaeota bacterium]